ncbi:MAG: PA2779 family protein [Candidatus Omnitrophica bacterium]|nr:PA2779 family protein [Candidatus Omnitrophota bacterium]
MFIHGLLKRKGVLFLMLTLAFFCGIAPQNGLGMPVDSQLIGASLNRSIYLEKVHGFLNQEIVFSRLSKLGLDKETALDYVNKLDDFQLRQLVDKIDTVEAASDSGTTVILFLLLLIFIILYFTDYGFKLEPRRKK